MQYCFYVLSYFCVRTMMYVYMYVRLCEYVNVRIYVFMYVCIYEYRNM